MTTPAPHDTAPALRLEQLCIDFTSDAGPIRAVHDLSIAVPHGGITCLVGESGCGKSLTAKAIMGLLPEEATVSGKIFLRGTQDNILQLPEKQWRRLRGSRMSMIFQEPMTALNPVLRVGFQAAEPLRLHQGYSKARAREEVIRLFTEVGISAPDRRYDDYPHQLSGGMRQRVMIAMALACQPQLLLADEPTTALDATIQGQILALLHKLSRKRGMATLLITHDLSVVAQMADTAGVMYAGHLVECGPASVLMHSPKHPYTRGLLRCAPTLDSLGKRRLDVIAGSVPPPGSIGAGCPFAPRCDSTLSRCFIEKPPLHPLTANPQQAVACWRVHTAPLDPCPFHSL